MTRLRALTLSAAVSVLALGLAAPPADAQTPTQQQTPKAGAGKSGAKSADRGSAKFVQQAAMSDMFEIQAAQVALEKSRNEQVRNFAQMMISEHQKMSGQLKTAAQGNNAAALGSTQLDRKHQQKLEQLRNATPANFDRMYMEMQVEGHREALKLHQDYSRNGDDAHLKQVASQAVPHVQQHLQQAQQIQRQAAQAPATGTRQSTPTEMRPDQNPTRQMQRRDDNRQPMNMPQEQRQQLRDNRN